MKCDPLPRGIMAVKRSRHTLALLEDALAPIYLAS